MGTRSITVVKSRWEPADEWTTHATIYRHWDGYPSAHGQDLAKFLETAKVGNGRRGNDPPEYCNGPGELASHLVAYLLKEGHNPNLEPPNTVMGQEFEYHILYDWKTMVIEIVVYDGPMTAFGTGGEDCTHEVFRGDVTAYQDWLAHETAEA